jgi:hypothetical protein
VDRLRDVESHNTNPSAVLGSCKPISSVYRHADMISGGVLLNLSRGGLLVPRRKRWSTAAGGSLGNIIAQKALCRRRNSVFLLTTVNGWGVGIVFSRGGLPVLKVINLTRATAGEICDSPPPAGFSHKWTYKPTSIVDRTQANSQQRLQAQRQPPCSQILPASQELPMRTVAFTR